MKKFYKYAAFLFFPLLAFQHPAVNAQGKQAKVVCVAFYNLENLFDTIDDPKIDDAELTPNGSGKWDSRKYYTKLSHMAEVISQIGD